MEIEEYCDKEFDLRFEDNPNPLRVVNFNVVE